MNEDDHMRGTSGWGAPHGRGAGSTGQIEDAHKALDCLDVAPGPLATRVLAAIGMIDRLNTELSNQRQSRLVGRLVERYRNI